MSEIKFKATKRLHDSGFRLIEKSGDLQFDGDPNAKDGIWLYVRGGGRIFIDCTKDGTFRIGFNGTEFVVQNDR